MKKILKNKKFLKKFILFLLVSVLCVVSIFSFFGCKKKENLNKLSAGLSEYNLEMEYDNQNKKVTLNEQFVFKNNTGSILKSLKFHLYPQFFKQGATGTIVASTHMNEAYPTGMSYADFSVERVKENGNECAVEYVGDYDAILNVPLSSSLLPNETAWVDLFCCMTLPNCFHRFGYGDDTINLANFYPVLCVFKDGEFDTKGYNSNGDPFYSEMANYDVTITTSTDFKVAGTGERVDASIVDGKSQTKFKAKLVRDFALVLSNKFEMVSKKVDDTLVEYYFYDDDHPEKSLKAGCDAIQVFEKLYGDYPYKNFSIVQCDFVYGGMEYPQLIMISDKIDDEDDYLNVIIHETAHQWWYGMLGNDEFQFPWLDEALTEFSTILFYDYAEGYNLTHEKMLKATHENYSLFLSVYQEVLGNLDTSMRPVDQYGTEPEYTYCTYVKGVLMYESLMKLVGEKKFVKSLKVYFEDNKYTNATPEDLKFAFEKTCGVDLDNFFASWLNGKVVIR